MRKELGMKFSDYVQYLHALSNNCLFKSEENLKSLSGLEQKNPGILPGGYNFSFSISIYLDFGWKQV